MEAFKEGLEARFIAQSSGNMKAISNKYLTSELYLDLEREVLKSNFNKFKDNLFVAQTDDYHEE